MMGGNHGSVEYLVIDLHSTLKYLRMPFCNGCQMKLCNITPTHNSKIQKKKTRALSQSRESASHIASMSAFKFF